MMGIRTEKNRQTIPGVIPIVPPREGSPDKRKLDKSRVNKGGWAQGGGVSDKVEKGTKANQAGNIKTQNRGGEVEV